MTIAEATSHHAIRQASLKEAYTSTTNMWKGDIYSKSLCNVIRILLRMHLALARMERYQQIKQQKAMKMQSKREKQSLDKQYRNSKYHLMNELGMAIINNRPTFVIQKIVERLQQSLQPTARNIQNDNQQSDQDLTDNTVFSDDEDTEEEEEEEKEEEKVPESSAKTIRALLSIVRMLTESSKIQRIVTSTDIQNAAFKGTIFTKRETMVAAKIVNFLRPFVPQRTEDNHLPKPHILTCAPLVALANTIATITGFPHLV